jgi:hypothetical protein
VGRKTSRELTPEEAKARLRAAVARTDIMMWSSYRPRDVVLVVFAVGVLTGLFPRLRQLLMAAVMGFMARQRER